jgi:hypothetical protein
MHDLFPRFDYSILDIYIKWHISQENKRYYNLLIELCLAEKPHGKPVADRSGKDKKMPDNMAAE